MFAALSLCSWSLARPTPLGTAFNYQGQLKQSGNPLNATADFEFKLFNAVTGGVQVGSTSLVNNVNIVNGLFTVSLDFGVLAFNGDQRWVEAQVRSPAGGGNFTTLTPRQALTATPYALYALTGPGSGGPWAVNGNNVFTTNTGNVGIGTTAPLLPLHIEHEDPVIILQDESSASQQSGYLGFWNNVQQETGWVGFGTPGSPHFSIFNARITGNIHLNAGPGGAVIVPTGNVGVGTSAPVAKLDVRGNIQLGFSGEYRATAGEENLRIIRGKVNSNGDILEGSGFDAVRDAEGQYTITFDAPFLDIPTMVASIEYQQGIISLNVDTVNSGQMKVYTWHHDNGSVDNAFHFIAIGPR